MRASKRGKRGQGSQHVGPILEEERERREGKNRGRARAIRKEKKK
jgi:hypothetical protein